MIDGYDSHQGHKHRYPMRKCLSDLSFGVSFVDHAPSVIASVKIQYPVCLGTPDALQSNRFQTFLRTRAHLSSLFQM